MIFTLHISRDGVQLDLVTLNHQIMNRSSCILTCPLYKSDKDIMEWLKTILQESLIFLSFSTQEGCPLPPMEAMACGRAVMISKTQGMVDYWQKTDAVIGIEVGDAKGMRQAILDALNNPKATNQLAQRGHEMVLKEHNSEQYLTKLIARLKAL